MHLPYTDDRVRPLIYCLGGATEATLPGGQTVGSCGQSERQQYVALPPLTAVRIICHHWALPTVSDMTWGGWGVTEVTTH